VSDFIGSGSTLKGLNFERVRDVEWVHDFPVIDATTDRAEAQRLFDASAEKWMLVLDAERRPACWVNGAHLARTDVPLDQAGPAVRAKVPPNATLHDALEELLMSNAGQAVVVDGHGRYLGILDVERLADVLKRMRAEAKKHYDELAAQQAVAGPGGVEEAHEVDVS